MTEGREGVALNEREIEEGRGPGTSQQSATTNAAARSGLWLLLTVAALAGVAPFATDLYLPTFTVMVGDLDTTAVGVQLTLTAFLIGTGIGQIFFGPLSDRRGRRAPLLMSAGLFVLVSIAAALAPSIGILIGLRFIQGFAAAGGMAIGRAVVSDSYHGFEAARAFSILAIVGGVAPVVAPIVGSAFANALGWRGLFWIVASLATLCFALAMICVPETNPTARSRNTLASRGHQRKGNLRDLRNSTFIGYAGVFALSFAIIMAYISASPFVLQSMMGLSNTVYGLLVAAVAVGQLVAASVAARLASSMAPERIVRLGLTIMTASVCIAILLFVLGVPMGWVIAALIIAVSATGLTMGSSTALALGAVPNSDGLGSGVLGLAQALLAGLAAPLVGIGGEETAVPLLVTVGAATLIALAAFRAGRREN